MKCFATVVPPELFEKPTTFLPPSDLVYGGLGLVVMTVLAFLIVTGFWILVKTKGTIIELPSTLFHRLTHLLHAYVAQPTDCNQIAQDQNQVQQKPAFEADVLPPPYESPSDRVGLPRTSQYSYTLVLPEQDILNHAAPFEPYHSHRRNSMDFDADLHVVDDAPPAQDDGNGSTETIPSLWEPSTFDEMPAENAEHMDHGSQQNGLVRSYSLDSSARFLAVNPVSHESRSDPALDGSARRMLAGSQSYAHRHVQLSMYRHEPRTTALTDLNGANANWNSNLNTRIENQRLPCRIDDNVEPNAPQAFVFDDSSENVEEAVGGVQSNGFFTRSLHFFLTQASYNMSQMDNSGEGERGSQDSGFFDHSRRRPATEELELGMAIYVKRSRQVD